MRAILFAIPILLLSNSLVADYYHLELGAGNYGQEGHTRKALFTTYGANNVAIRNKTAFFEGISENATQAILPIKAAVQYRVLFRTLDELVTRNLGEQIVFHINDLVPEWAEYACAKLREYAASQKYDVVVEPVGGNYFLLDSAITLASYGAGSYDSVHLKNPELMYGEAVERDEPVVTDASRHRMRTGLQKLANLGKHGLHFFIINRDDYFPHFERTQYAMRGKFYMNTTEWKGLGYDLPDGIWSSPKEASHVFFIARQAS
jgi:hypothetical protein